METGQGIWERKRRGVNWVSTWKRMKNGIYLTPHTANSKWIMSLNAEAKTVCEENHCDLG